MSDFCSKQTILPRYNTYRPFNEHAEFRVSCNALEFASSNAHCCYGALNVNDKRVITKSTHTQFICLKKFVFVTDAVLLLRGMLL